MLPTRDQTLPCPVCATPIPFDARQLLQGAAFSCTNCGSSVSLANESKPLVEQALAAFDAASAGMRQGTSSHAG